MKISVVTPSLNGLPYLRDAARSVLSQEGSFGLEWVIIDGGSTDGTAEFVEELAAPRVRWSSEPDRGQAHALNKALGLADGDVIGWLNTDDLYAPGALAAVAEAFERNPAAQWLAGHEVHGVDVRFDVVAVLGTELSVIEGAF